MCYRASFCVFYILRILLVTLSLMVSASPVHCPEILEYENIAGSESISGTGEGAGGGVSLPPRGIGGSTPEKKLVKILRYGSF